jgi:hypothetical protein
MTPPGKHKLPGKVIPGTTDVVLSCATQWHESRADGLAAQLTGFEVCLEDAMTTILFAL